MQDFKFYGQGHFIGEYKKIVERINQGFNYNLIFTGPSGYGKTHLAIITMLLTQPKNSKIYVPSMGTINFYPKVRIHFIDEVHTLQVPEFLYPLMDSGNYTILLATNKLGALPEALWNRCINFSFVDYTSEDLFRIARDRLPELPDDSISLIINSSTGTPRNIDQLCKRVKLFLSGDASPNRIKTIVEEYLGIIGGLTPEERLYMDTLKKVGRASLDLICGMTRLDKTLVTSDIEPHLIKLGLMEISSKGRIIK